MSKKDNKQIWLSDTPDIENDAFEIHSKIADTLYHTLIKHDVSKKAFTIGLFGEWGSGKSFIINKLEQKIKIELKNITYLYIDAWKYSGFPLLREILFDLERQFQSYHQPENKNCQYILYKDGYKNDDQKHLINLLHCDESFESYSKITSDDFKEKLKEIYKTYKIPYILLVSALLLFLVFLFFPSYWFEITWVNKIYEVLKVMAPISSFIGIGGILLAIFKKPLSKISDLILFRNTIKNFTEKANFSPEQFERIFKDMLNKIKGNEQKFVIVFDNIDRCDPKTAYETLSTIKTYMDTEKCFYIIPADDEAIKKYLSNFKNRGNSEQDEDKTNDSSISFEREFADEFVDKIFQTYIRIPVLKEVDRDKFIRDKLNEIDFGRELLDEEVETITQILYYAYKGESPRNIIRFINDYSTYYHIAKNSLPELLENITLFTIIIAIKQKWNDFEKKLIDNPSFFYEYFNYKETIQKDTEINNSILTFLDNVLPAYKQQIYGASIDSYIYLKKSEKSYDIDEKLKEKEYEKILLNDETIKILKKSFKKYLLLSGAFKLNSFLTFSLLIRKKPENHLTNKLIEEFWMGIKKLPQSEIIDVLGGLLKEEDNLLVYTLDTLKALGNAEVDIEIRLISCLEEPIERNVENLDVYRSIFKSILESKYRFEPAIVKNLFKQWKKENKYLNSLLDIICENNKIDYLPESVLVEEFLKIIKDKIDDDSINLISKYWGRDFIPEKQGVNLTEVVFERIKNKKIRTHEELVIQRPEIQRDYKLLMLINKSFVKQELIEDFVKHLAILTNNVLKYSKGNEAFVEIGVKLWLEIAYYEGLNNKHVDSKMKELFDKHISENNNATSILLKNMKYPDNLLKLPETKLSIFSLSNKLQKHLYNKYIEQKKLQKATKSEIKKLLPDKIEITQLNTLNEFFNENEISYNKIELVEYALKSIITELIEHDKDITKKLTWLNENFDLTKHRKLILNYKNGIFDYIKKFPSNSYEILKELNIILTGVQFSNEFLKPFLNHINKELEDMRSIAEFANIDDLIDSTSSKEYKSILYSIASKCLEQYQDIKENYLGIKIIEKIINFIPNEQKKEIKNLIESNDNFSKWTDDIINTLENLKILEPKSKGEKEIADFVGDKKIIMNINKKQQEVFFKIYNREVRFKSLSISQHENKIKTDYFTFTINNGNEKLFNAFQNFLTENNITFIDYRYKNK